MINKAVEQINKKVSQEIQKSFLQLKGSYLDESHSAIDMLKSPNLGGEKQSQNSLEILLDRKVDQMDFNNMLNTKSNKKDTQIMNEQIAILHRQID